MKPPASTVQHKCQAGWVPYLGGGDIQFTWPTAATCPLSFQLPSLDFEIPLFPAAFWVPSRDFGNKLLEHALA